MYSIIFIGNGFVLVYGTLFLALGKAKEGGIISLARQGFFFIPISFILAARWGINGVIVAQPVADLLTILLVVYIKKKTEIYLQLYRIWVVYKYEKIDHYCIFSDIKKAIIILNSINIENKIAYHMY